MASGFPPITELVRQIRSSETESSDYDGKNRQALLHALSSLFESSPTLTKEIIPSLVQRFQSIPTEDEDKLPKDYRTLIDIATDIVSSLPENKKAEFIGAHPRIGEVKNLSALSAAEQGQTANIPQPTPPEVLSRLAFLNALYEKRYPHLVYVTFVNGRSRAQIRDELETKLHEEGISVSTEEPYGLQQIEPHQIGSDAWRRELERAITAVQHIAYSRLHNLGVS